MKKKLVVLLMMAAILTGLFTGCGNKATETKTDTTQNTKAETKTETKTDNESSKTVADATPVQKIELEFWGWWGSEARKPNFEKMVADFNASQDKYHVTYVHIPWGDIFTKNVAQIAAGNPCDIMANSMEEVRFRASQSQVEKIDSFITDDVKNGFYSQYLDACTGEDGSLYALPLSVDTRAIYYNKAHFNEAGVKPEDIKTWKDLEDAARKLDKKNGNKWERVGFMPLLGNGALDTWIINANQGTGYFDPKTGDIVVNTDKNKDVLKWIRSWIEYYGQDEFNSLSAAFGSGMADPFASGVMSMLTHTSAYQSSLAKNAPDLEYGIIPLPEYTAGNGHTANGGGFVLEIPKGAKNPEGSYEFIKFMTSRDGQDFLSTKMGDFSARNDFDETSNFFQKPINQDLAKCLEETVTVIIPNELKGYQEVINPLIEEGTLGITEAGKALDNAQKAFEDFAASNK